MARQSAVSAPILHHTYSCHDRHVLRRALRILKRAGSPVIPAAEEVAHAVNTREGVSGRSLQQHLRATGVLAEEGSRVEADEAAMREQVVEAEKRKLDDEEEVFWADMSGVDWRQRCLQHLAQDPLHVCKFAGRVDKCSRCVTQGRSGAACVDVPECCEEEAQRLLYCAHQARHYQSSIALEQVRTAVVLLGCHMQQPRVRRAGVPVDEVPEDHVQVVVLMKVKVD